MNLMNVAIVIGMMFGPLAAIVAFVISYEEYRHHFHDKKKAVLLSLKSAMVTLIVVAVVTFIAGYCIPLVMRR